MMENNKNIVFNETGTSFTRTVSQKLQRKVEQFMKDENANRHWKVQKKNVLELLDPRPGDNFLDIGCGAGKFEIYISPLTKITALDISDEMLGTAKFLVQKYGKPENVAFKKQQLPLRNMFPQSTFNKIFMADSSEHMPLRILNELLADIKTLLSPDGLLIIYTPNKSHFLERMKPVSMTGHINVMTMDEMVNILEDSGFSILKNYYRFSHLPVLGFLERYIPFSLFKRRLCVKAQLQKS